jgi:hypothetical protein
VPKDWWGAGEGVSRLSSQPLGQDKLVFNMTINYILYNEMTLCCYVKSAPNGTVEESKVMNPSLATALPSLLPAAARAS